MKPRFFYGWLLLPALWVVLCINVAFTMFGSTVLNPAMAADLGFGREALGLVFSVFTLMSGLPGPLVALCVNRFGIRLTLALGSALVGCGALLMGTSVHSAWSAVLVFGVVVGAGSITGGVLAAQTSATFWFVRRRALAMSLLMTAGGGGGFIAPSLLNWAIDRSGGRWQAGWWLIALLALAAVLIALLLVRERPADVGQQPDGDAAPTTAGGDAAPQTARQESRWMFADALRAPVLWLMMLAGGGLTAGFMTYLAHGVAHMHDLGHPPAVAALSMSLLSITTLCGSLLAGFLGDRMELRSCWAAALALFGVGIYLVTGAAGPALLYACSIMLGLGFGCATVCLMTAVGNYFGSGIYASLVGIVLAVQTIFGGVASWAAGALFDRTGHYNAMFGCICVACVLLAAALAVVRPPRQAHAAAVRAG